VTVRDYLDGTYAEHAGAQLKNGDTTEANDERIRYLSPAEDKRLRQALAERDERMARERANANAWRKERGYELMPKIDGIRAASSPLQQGFSQFWLSAALPSHGRGHWFDPSTAHQQFQAPTQRQRPA
jgi:hypothetical protein